MIKILVIEDDNNQIRMLKDAVDAWNLTCDEHKYIEAEFFNDDSDIYKKIFYVKYDCIVLDIDWGDGKELGGKELATKIIASKRIPIFIYSGNINKIDDMPEQLGFKKFRRSEIPFNEVLNEVVKLKSLKIFDLLSYEGSVDETIRQIFWQDINEIQEFLKDVNIYEHPDSLTRIMTTRITEALSKGNGSPQKFFEFFIYPSLDTSLNNGDIYRLNFAGEENFFLSITPTCQLLNSSSNVKNVNFLKIEFTHDKLSEIKNATSETSREKILRNLINKPPDCLHFIPSCNGKFEMGVINFNDIISVPKNEVASDAKVVTVNPAYMKDIQARFSQYFSKQGQPGIDTQHFLDSVNIK